MLLKNTLRLLVVMFCLLACGPALADIYKCLDADGTITYTDEGCPEGAREVERVPGTPSAETQKTPPKVPLKDRLNGLLHPARFYKYLSMKGVLGIYGVLSVVCFIAYYRDKRKAIQGQWRTPESTLHLLELLGGWPGGLLAQLVLRHKIRKVSYQATFWLIVFLHGLLWADLRLDHRMSRAALGLIRGLF
jgi:uncharacterized membrane protein YsdA (DUF1294 family)